MESDYRRLIDGYESPTEEENLRDVIIDFHCKKSRVRSFDQKGMVDQRTHLEFQQQFMKNSYKKKLCTRSSSDSHPSKRNYTYLTNQQIKELQGYFRNNRFEKAELCHIFGVSQTSMMRFIKEFTQHGKLFPRQRRGNQDEEPSQGSRPLDITSILEANDMIGQKQMQSNLRRKIERSIKSADINLLAYEAHMTANR